MTCKEGHKRGFVYQYTDKTMFSSWDLHNKPVDSREPWTEMAPNGFSAVLHNRNISDPVMIGLSDEEVCLLSN